MSNFCAVLKAIIELAFECGTRDKLCVNFSDRASLINCDNGGKNLMNYHLI